MCLNPLYLPNKAYKRLGGMPFIECPCGQCQECCDTKGIDYFIRAWTMYKSLPQYYSVFFCTFTFNNENLPRLEYFKNGQSQGLFPCFNHKLLHTFCKSYQQYYRRLGKDKVHMLFTSEFGDKTGRPHYHGIIFVPRLIDWKSFKTEIEKYWHYGFTKNVRIVNKDGMSYERDIKNSFKYVTKYACKGSSKLPVWMTDPDAKYLPYTPYMARPRVFTTNDFGLPLLSTLNPNHYVQNKMVLSIDGKPQTYNVPSYFKRRHFTYDVVKDKYRCVIDDGWYPPRTVTKYVKESHYKNDYATVRYKIYLHKYKAVYEKLLQNYPQFHTVKLDDFLKYAMHYYDKSSEFYKYRYHRRSKQLDIFDSLKLVHTNKDSSANFWQIRNELVSLPQNKINGTSTITSSADTDRICADLLLLAHFQMASEKSHRAEQRRYQSTVEQEYYRYHNVRKEC